jgi:mannose-6-phosphate isomerase-like protein (cupin superfamily)
VINVVMLKAHSRGGHCGESYSAAAANSADSSREIAPMILRRVVTGLGSDGQSLVISDGPVKEEPLPGGGVFFRIWSMDEPALYPGHLTSQENSTVVPPVGGLRAFVFTIAPDGGPQSGSGTEGMAGAGEMHQANTTDFVIVLSGEAVLETSDGSRALLRSGDTVVNNGTLHRWRNEGSEPAILAACIVGALVK